MNEVYKKWNKRIVYIVSLLLATIVTINYFIDPLQFYRKAQYPPVFSENQRFQNPGLVKNYDYNSIIIGTSVTENFRPSYVDSQFGSNMTTVKLSMGSATLHEEYILADFALKAGKTKTIIWGLDLMGLDLLGSKNNINGEFPAYLYAEDSLESQIKYLLNGTTTKQTIKVLVNNFRGNSTPIPLDYLNTWENKHTFSKEKVLSDYYLNKVNEKEIKLDKIEVFQDSINKKIIKLIEDNPEVQFYFFYPPYSVLRYKYFYEKNSRIIDYDLYLKEYFFNQIGEKKNVKIFDFQDDYVITDNLYIYKDMIHYSPEINQYIIDEMVKDNTPRAVNKENYKKRISDFLIHLQQYQVVPKEEEVK